MPANRHLPLIISLIVLSAATRLLPHPPNFVPVGAMALFGAAALPKRWLMFIVPMLAFYLSDVVLNNTLYAGYYEGLYFGTSTYTLVALALMVALGAGLLRGKSFNWLRIGGSALGATAIFFLVTNFGVWATGLMYPKTGAGLLAAYAAGLPFLLNSLLANLLFSAVLFGIAKSVGVFTAPGPRSAAVLVD